MTITVTRVERFRNYLRECREMIAQMEQRVKDKEALRHLGHASTNLKLALIAVEKAGEEVKK